MHIVEGIPKDILALLTQLLPGFVTAWVVYGLTSYPKPAQFERVIQGIVYSFLVGVLVKAEEAVLAATGSGEWSRSSELLASGLSAVVLGLTFAFFSNNDKFYKFARALNWTKRTAYPSEWYGAFSARPPRYVVLHIEGARRILGYPREWPSDPASGHFRLENAAWLADDGGETALDRDDSILIPATQVELVEFLKSEEELTDAAKTAQSPSP